MRETVATYQVNGQAHKLEVEKNGNGTWTAWGPQECRDYASRGACVRWLKKVYANPGVAVLWSE